VLLLLLMMLIRVFTPVGSDDVVHGWGYHEKFPKEVIARVDEVGVEFWVRA